VERRGRIEEEADVYLSIPLTCSLKSKFKKGLKTIHYALATVKVLVPVHSSLVDMFSIKEPRKEHVFAMLHL
jgi:hypothetical protein